MDQYPAPYPDSGPLAETVPVAQVLGKLVSEVRLLVSLGCEVVLTLSEATFTLSRNSSIPLVLKIAIQYFVPAMTLGAGQEHHVPASRPE